MCMDLKLLQYNDFDQQRILQGLNMIPLIIPINYESKKLKGYYHKIFVYHPYCQIHTYLL